jgi:dihydrofolate synthase/folylpolyglutamate synthase
MFHRIGGSAYKADLENTLEICRILGNPERNFRTIHVGGTNGKGSTSHLIASVLQTAGYKTGLYTSPHLKDFRERIRIDGKKIPKSYVTSFVGKNRKLFDHIRPSFFEYTIGMAFEYFSEEKVDVAVIEVGLGGRLDSTNVITPELSIITNIGFDHIAFLGNTLEKIAFEKAGIIKPGIPVVIGESQPQTEEIFKQVALKNDSPIFFADHTFQLTNLKTSTGKFPKISFKVLKRNHEWISSLLCPLTGNYQQKNIITVLKALDILSRKGFEIDKEIIHKGFDRIIINTGFQGRWQKLSDHPKVICDVGHNEDGMKYVVQQLSEESFEHLHFVFGMVNDKDFDHILSILPESATYYFCKANIPRGLDATILKTKASGFMLTGDVFGSVREAFEAAKCRAGKNDLIFVGGSTFVVAEVL